MLKSIIVEDISKKIFEETINTIINGEHPEYQDFQELISISFSHNHNSVYLITSGYSALIIYKTI